MTFAWPLDEALRQDALEAQKITDTAPDNSFDRVVRLACAALSTPVGLITFVDGERQWFKAKQGMAVRAATASNSTWLRKAFPASGGHGKTAAWTNRLRN